MANVSEITGSRTIRNFADIPVIHKFAGFIANTSRTLNCKVNDPAAYQLMYEAIIKRFDVQPFLFHNPTAIQGSRNWFNHVIKTRNAEVEYARLKTIWEMDRRIFVRNEDIFYGSSDFSDIPAVFEMSRKCRGWLLECNLVGLKSIVCPLGTFSVTRSQSPPRIIETLQIISELKATFVGFNIPPGYRIRSIGGRYSADGKHSFQYETHNTCITSAYHIPYAESNTEIYYRSDSLDLYIFRHVSGVIIPMDPPVKQTPLFKSFKQLQDWFTNHPLKFADKREKDLYWQLNRAIAFYHPANERNYVRGGFVDFTPEQKGTFDQKFDFLLSAIADNWQPKKLDRSTPFGGYSEEEYTLHTKYIRNPALWGTFWNEFFDAFGLSDTVKSAGGITAQNIEALWIRNDSQQSIRELLGAKPLPTNSGKS